MANYCTPKLEFSPDPLSDTTPAWVDVTRFCLSAEWASGKAKDLDDAQAGVATFMLRSVGRMFEPEYAAGAFYPNIVPLRRFRFSLTPTGGASSQEGIFYATNWEVTYPAGTTESTVRVTCVDGFGLLSLDTLPAFDPASSESAADVIRSDEPLAFYLLDDTGAKMAADVGPEGTYTRGVLRGVAPIVPGSNEHAVTFTDGTHGLAKIDDPGWFANQNAFSCECVFAATSLSGNILAGPNTSLGVATFSLSPDLIAQSYVRIGNSAIVVNGSGALLNGNPHHVCLTWDGNTLRLYEDGVLFAQSGIGGGPMDSPAAGSSMQVGFTGAGTGAATMQYAAFYEHALPATRVAAHAAATLSHGYAVQDAGSRIAAIVANPLWSTAAIPASPILVEPRFQAGVPRLDEALTTAQAEYPFGFLFFNNAGNPQYVPWQTGAVTPAAVFGDAAGEIRYTALELVYDDEIYNEVQVSREGGELQTVQDATSQGAYGSRSLQRTDLILENDADADMVALELLARFQQPRFRIATLTLNGADARARTQILTREIGDVIRVRRLSSSTAPIDVITTILGKSKAFDPDGNLTCQWTLARGFNASTQVWRLGVQGFDELNSHALLA